MYADAQINKQLEEQKIDLEYNIDNIGRTLAKCEMYVFRFGDQKKVQALKPIFGYYNRFENANERPKLDLYKSIVSSVKFVKYGFEETLSKYNYIQFPYNMSKEQIIEYIQKLMSFLIEKDEKSIFLDLIDVIKGKNINLNKYKNLFDKNAKMDTKKVMESYPQMSKAFQIKEENWKKAAENPNYNPGFNLNQNFHDDPAFYEYEKYKNSNITNFQ